jgi:general secretion pathway protein M
VNIADRFARLNAREQRILNAFLLGVGVLLVVVLPTFLSVLVHGKRSENEALRDAASSIADSREAIDKLKLEKAATMARYANPAPPLAAFLAGLATDAGVEIPESQDRQAVPHGKKYTERSTKIALHKVGMLKLSKFLEHIEQSGNPITITSLNIRKRGSEPDNYDVEMMVSAFDRSSAADAPKKPAAAAAASAEGVP